MVRMMGRMRRRVVLGRVVVMLLGMQLVAVGLLGMVGFRLVLAVMVGLVGLAMMVGGGFQMMRGFFVMIVLGHLELLEA
jgi:hypothetical protein